MPLFDGEKRCAWMVQACAVYMYLRKVIKKTSECSFSLPSGHTGNTSWVFWVMTSQQKLALLSAPAFKNMEKQWMCLLCWNGRIESIKAYPSGWCSKDLFLVVCLNVVLLLIWKCIHMSFQGNHSQIQEIVQLWEFCLTLYICNTLFQFIVWGRDPCHPISFITLEHFAQWIILES